MIDVLRADSRYLHQTQRLLCDEFKKRGWKAYVPYITSSLVHVVRDDGVAFDINDSTPPTTSFVAAKTADNKYATYSKLESLPVIRQLETRMLDGTGEDKAVTYMLKKYSRVVIKPLSGAHGHGVTTNISSIYQAKNAMQVARQDNTKRTLLVQAHYEARSIHEVRILCIQGRYIAATYRQPARVFGDGIHTTAQLINLENDKPNRGDAYVKPYAYIDKDAAAAYLGKTIECIPQKREQVNVLGVANYGMGGETIDVTDDLPAWMKDDAVAIANHMNLPLVGIDFIMSRYPSRELSREELDVAVLEVNRSPSLGIHDEPNEGVSRGAVASYVDYLASLY